MSVDPQTVGASIRRLLDRERQSDAEDDLLTSLRGVVDACLDLFGVTGAGVMVLDEMNDSYYLAASDGQGRLLELLERQTMEGPCTDALVHDQVVTTDDLWADSRWPAFRAALAEEPELRAVLGVPVKLGAVNVGTLDVFHDHPHSWTDDEREALARYADVVRASLTSVLAAHTASEQAAQLQYALDYRVVIERGVGYLMARDQVDAVTAFNRLRNAARSSRTKIGRVAQVLLDGGRLP